MVIAMRVTFLMFVHVLACAFLAPAALAQDGGMSQEKCTIAGTVVDAASGQPLRGAEVRLRGTGGVSVSGTQSSSANTDASGRFVFEGLSAGRYVLMASHDGYARNDREGPG